MQSIFDQLFAFLVTIGIGFLAGILFDIYRVLRLLWAPRKLGTFIGDILFWLIMTFVVFSLLLVGNWGELRIYVFIGISVGVYLYMRFLSKKWQKIIRHIFIFAFKILTGLGKLISWPIKMVMKILIIPIGFLIAGLNSVMILVKKGLKAVASKIKIKKNADDDEEKI
ncbi:MAG: spore cortex biosynthesis protein YabQ [Clostridia bacterium]|nr:spore cortex biosynthesis protein YabQ [Clostridia bacterium]